MYKKRFLGVLLAFMIAAGSVPAAVSAGDTDMGQSVVLDSVSQGEQEQNVQDAESASVREVGTEADLKQAVADANSGIISTIRLKASFSVSASGIANNMAALSITHDGVTIDGNNQTLTVDCGNSKANFLGIDGCDGVTVRNLTIINGGQAKHGINVYKSTNVTLENISVQNMGGLGLLVNASTVTATGTLSLSGNGWGNGINVGWGDVKDENAVCNFTSTDSTLNGATIYTDLSDITNAAGKPITVNVSGYVKVEDPTSIKEDKAAIYMAESSVPVTVTGTESGSAYYVSFAKAVAAAPAGATVALNQNVTVNQAVNIAKDITINGNGHTLTANGCAALQIGADLSSLNVSNLTIQGNLTAEKANDGTDAYMGLGTYNGCYGVGRLELSNVVIDGFSYGLYFGKNTTGAAGSYNENPVSVVANNLTVQNCYIKGGYFEKLTDSTFNGCTFANNGIDPAKVSSDANWLCGLDINLKNGSYQDISFNGCTFTGNGANRGTALHIKARNDGNYGADTRLTGVTISGCTFTGNNAADTGASGIAFGPVVFGEPGKGNASPTGVSIQQGVGFTNNVAGVSVVRFDNADTATQIVANGEFTLPAPVKDGFTFKGWKNGENTYDAGTKVTVSGGTTFTAVWEENTSTETPDVQKTYTVTVNGQAVEYKAGETVSISAPVYNNGLVFSRWVVVSGNVTLANAYSNNTTFVMPEGNVEIEPVYTYIYVEPEQPEYNPGHSGSTGGSSNNGGSSSTETVMPENGFGTDKNGNTFFFEDGEKVKGWVQDGDTWYYMDSHDGSMTTDGWAEVDGTWYNFAEDGKMNTGWVQDGETWYYLKDWGGMATGWQQVDGKWYYLKDSGAMATGWVKTGDTWYLLKDSGAMATGWQQVNGKWYYLKASGAMATGWVEVNGKWYYLKADGSMATNTTINGYYVNSDGEWVK